MLDIQLRTVKMMVEIAGYQWEERKKMFFKM